MTIEAISHGQDAGAGQPANGTTGSATSAGADRDQHGGRQRIERALDAGVPAGVAGGGEQHGDEDEQVHQRGPCRPLGQLPVVVEHRLQQHLRALGALLLGGELRLVVADAAAARHEDHRGRRDARDIGRVVAGAGDDVARANSRTARRARRTAATQSGIEPHRRLVPDRLHRDAEPERLADLRQRRVERRLHGVEHGVVGMAQVDA